MLKGINLAMGGGAAERLWLVIIRLVHRILSVPTDVRQLQSAMI